MFNKNRVDFTGNVVGLRETLNVNSTTTLGGEQLAAPELA